MLTPLRTAEVIHLRVENRQRLAERLTREIAELEQRGYEIAHEIWLKKLELEGAQPRG